MSMGHFLLDAMIALTCLLRVRRRRLRKSLDALVVALRLIRRNLLRVT